MDSKGNQQHKHALWGCVNHLFWTNPSFSCRLRRCCSRASQSGTLGCSSWSDTQSSHSAQSQAEQYRSATWRVKNNTQTHTQSLMGFIYSHWSYIYILSLYIHTFPACCGQAFFPGGASRTVHSSLLLSGECWWASICEGWTPEHAPYSTLWPGGGARRSDTRAFIVSWNRRSDKRHLKKHLTMTLVSGACSHFRGIQQIEVQIYVFFWDFSTSINNALSCWSLRCRRAGLWFQTRPLFESVVSDFFTFLLGLKSRPREIHKVSI